jgi:hypothetical protein
MRRSQKDILDAGLNSGEALMTEGDLLEIVFLILINESNTH